MGEGDPRLKGTKYLWLRSLEKRGEDALKSVESRVQINLKTSRTWQLKTIFERFWKQPDKESGRAFFKKWKNRAVRSRLPYFVSLARSLESSLEELLNY